MNVDVPWKRFWHELGTRLSLADGGFLPDPDTLGGQFYNPGLFTLKDLDQEPCLILLGEPGIGKSRAARQEIERLGGCAYIADLGEYGSEFRIREAIFSNNTINQWAATDGDLCLVLDSFHESRLPPRELVGF